VAFHQASRKPATRLLEDFSTALKVGPHSVGEFTLKARTGRVCNKIERSALLSLVTHACHGFRAAEVRPFTKDCLQRDGVIVVSAKRKKVKQPQ
jgi:hypothetical protein